MAQGWCHRVVPAACLRVIDGSIWGSAGVFLLHYQYISIDWAAAPWTPQCLYRAKRLRRESELWRVIRRHRAHDDASARLLGLWSTNNAIRHDTRYYFNVRSKADMSSLIYRMEPTTKKIKTDKLKSKKRICYIIYTLRTRPLVPVTPFSKLSQQSLQ